MLKEVALPTSPPTVPRPTIIPRPTWKAGNLQAANPDEPIIDLVEAFRLVRRQVILIASILVLAIFGGVAYLAAATPLYTGSSILLFDVRRPQPFQQQGYQSAGVDSAYIDSQVEVLQSGKIARAVIKNLDLLSDAEFVRPERSLFATILGRLNAIFDLLATILGRLVFDAGKGESYAVSGESEELRRAVGLFSANLTIKRVGLTYIIHVDYRSIDANKAARISNAVTDAYAVAQLESKYQAAHHASSWLQGRVEELRTQAQNAERAIAEYSAKNNITDRDARLLSEQQLADLADQRRVALKDLESSAQASRALYETFLQRVAEVTQQQSFPATEVRVISPASPSLEKSHPKTLHVLAAVSLLGLVGGLAAAFARERLNPILRSPSQLETDVGINCLGMFPAIRSSHRSGELSPRKRRQKTQNHERGEATPRVISRDAGRYRFVVIQPFSPCTETIRSLKVAADFAGLRQRSKVIGITSALPREGKSMIAANLSQLIAEGGRKTLLIDCDLRSLRLTRELAPNSTVGLLEAIAGQATVEDLVWRDPITKLDFLPAVLSRIRTIHPSASLSSAGMQELLVSVQQRYDYVILDLPAIAPVADVKAAAHLIDSFILVIEWGRTPQQAVIDALNAAPLVSEKLLGAVLNKSPGPR